MSWAEISPEALKSARGSRENQLLRKSITSMTSEAPEPLKSAVHRDRSGTGHGLGEQATPEIHVPLAAVHRV
jgi:hypothetical protein